MFLLVVLIQLYVSNGEHPRSEHQRTSLDVEWEEQRVDLARGLENSGEVPLHVAVWRYDRRYGLGALEELVDAGARGETVKFRRTGHAVCELGKAVMLSKDDKFTLLPHFRHLSNPVVPLLFQNQIEFFSIEK